MCWSTKEFRAYCEATIPQIQSYKQLNDYGIYRFAAIAAILYIVYGSLLDRAVETGVYLVLFGTCIHVLFKRKPGRYRIHFLAILTLFVLATAALVISTITQLDGITVASEATLLMTAPLDLCLESVPSLRDMSGSDQELFNPAMATLASLNTVRQALLIASNIVTDSILANQVAHSSSRYGDAILSGGGGEDSSSHRRKPTAFMIFFAVIAIAFMAYFPSVFAAGTPTGTVQFSGLYLYTIFLSFSVATNLLLSFLIAGRIAYIARVAIKYVGKDVRNMYRTVIAITLESGLIYPAVLVIFVACKERIGDDITGLASSVAIAAQFGLHLAAGIAPTLVIVRTSLGVAIEDTKSCISTFRAGERADLELPLSTGPVLDISRSASVARITDDGNGI
ncbi:hypothetical protein VNI00_007632 [Paramarasmius palmivorus]|uniref:Uncharacterized protein n=1 Tax=Paramarasmius palmivorus TaxID=297713 RepID=A0AAW0CZR5_9AGAR